MILTAAAIKNSFQVIGFLVSSRGPMRSTCYDDRPPARRRPCRRHPPRQQPAPGGTLILNLASAFGVVDEPPDVLAEETAIDAAHTNDTVGVDNDRLREAANAQPLEDRAVGRHGFTAIRARERQGKTRLTLVPVGETDQDERPTLQLAHNPGLAHKVTVRARIIPAAPEG